MLGVLCPLDFFFFTFLHFSTIPDNLLPHKVPPVSPHPGSSCPPRHCPSPPWSSHSSPASCRTTPGGGWTGERSSSYACSLYALTTFSDLILRTGISQTELGLQALETWTLKQESVGQFWGSTMRRNFIWHTYFACAVLFNTCHI